MILYRKKKNEENTSKFTGNLVAAFFLYKITTKCALKQYFSLQIYSRKVHVILHVYTAENDGNQFPSGFCCSPFFLKAVCQ